jgi:glycolate oxidase
VPLEQLGACIKGLRRIAAACGFQVVIFGHAGDANVHANMLVDVHAADLADRLERCLREVSAVQIALGGTTTGEHGDGRLRAPFLEALYGATYLEGCRRVKAAFDPRGIMNPGVKLTADGPRLTADMLKVGSGAPALPAGVADALRRIEREALWGQDRLNLPSSAVV